MHEDASYHLAPPVLDTSTLSPSPYYQITAVTPKVDAYKLFSLTSIITFAGFLLLFYTLHTLYKEFCRRRHQKLANHNLINSCTEQSIITLYDPNANDPGHAWYGSIA